jgi:hypothetical protein
MYVIRLPNGNLRVPHSAITTHESSGAPTRQVIGHAYIEIGPDDPDYSRFAEHALTEEEWADKQRDWREGDDALLREFEEWKAQQGEE